MLEFDHIWAFALLPLPWIARGLLPPHYEPVAALRTPFVRRLAEATRQTPRKGSVILKRKSAQKIAAILVWCLLVAGVAKPQWAGEPVVRTEAGRDVMLAIDISGSMDKRDFIGGGASPVSRLDAVKQVVGDFIESREGDRIGLIVFGSKAYVQVPFTQDLYTARALLEAVEVGMAGPHTALGDAIGLAIRTFEVSELEQRLLIVLTDGADTGSRMSPINAASIANQNGVSIHTIGVGDPDGTGEDRVDFETLNAIASQAGGNFFTADDSAGLADVYDEIDKLTPSETRITAYRPHRSLVHWPVGGAVFVALPGLCIVLLGSSRRRRQVTHA